MVKNQFALDREGCVRNHSCRLGNLNLLDLPTLPSASESFAQGHDPCRVFQAAACLLGLLTTALFSSFPPPPHNGGAVEG